MSYLKRQNYLPSRVLEGIYHFGGICMRAGSACEYQQTLCQLFVPLVFQKFHVSYVYTYTYKYMHT